MTSYPPESQSSRASAGPQRREQAGMASDPAADSADRPRTSAATASSRRPYATGTGGVRTPSFSSETEGQSHRPPPALPHWEPPPPRGAIPRMAWARDARRSITATPAPLPSARIDTLIHSRPRILTLHGHLLARVVRI